MWQLLVGLGVPVLTICLLVYSALKKKRGGKSYLHLISVIKSNITGEISPDLANSFIKNRMDRFCKKIFGGQISFKPLPVYVVQYGPKKTMDMGEFFILAIETFVNVPYLYIFSPHSNYDTFEEKQVEQIEAKTEYGEMRALVTRGAHVELYRLIDNSPQIRRLMEILRETEMDLEFKNGWIYIWFYYLNRQNVGANDYENLMEVKDLAANYLLTKLKSLEKDFNVIEETYSKKYNNII